MKKIFVAALMLTAGCASRNDSLSSDIAKLESNERQIDSKIAQVEVEAAGLHTMVNPNALHGYCQAWSATDMTISGIFVYTVHLSCNDGSQCTMQRFGRNVRTDCLERKPFLTSDNK